MLIGYSQGLHHIHVPDESRFPNLFQPVRMRLEALDVEEYREALREVGGDSMKFRKAVVEDLTARRDRYCTSDVGGRDEVASARIPT